MHTGHVHAMARHAAHLAHIEQGNTGRISSSSGASRASSRTLSCQLAAGDCPLHQDPLLQPPPASQPGSSNQLTYAYSDMCNA
mmetsp:Transcript_1163/g.2594  ORF Transcript_1163/g.2594 Transcript_1163/m.2594 type:complete len:83 (+) Transcript_1163:199-447(+)